MTPVVILAGGQATRMGGGDKCLIPLGDQVLLDIMLNRLSDQTDQVVLNANGSAARFADYGLTVLPDTIIDGGPLSGVLAALDWAADLGYSSVVSVAGDTPFFPSDLVARLGNHAPLALAATAEGERIFWQPTFGLWPVALRDNLRAALTNGVRKVVQWTNPHKATQVVWDGTDHNPFFNINTPDDVEIAKGML